MARLRRSDCASPGIARRGRGRGFQYLDPAGERIDDPEVLERIAQLGIPPAWREVWICMDPRGHLQATGIDAAKRKQYLYHERWRVHRDRRKFDGMIAFGQALPALRRHIKRDLASETLSRTQVLACAVRLLDLGFFRIGSEDYAERNESYGLTTLLVRHVSIEGEQVVFDYPAKSGQRRIQAIVDPEVLAIVTRLKRRKSSTKLLAHREGRRWVELHSDEVNAYLKELAGGEFSAKDFRTWNATVLAAVALSAEVAQVQSAAARKRAVSGAVKTVAAYLGNTPAVARASYVDPRVIDRYRSGHTIAAAIGGLREGADMANARTRARVEGAVLELLAEAA